MPICTKCGLDVCNPCFSKVPHKNERIIIVATDGQLSRISHFQRLALALRATKQELNLSRRQIPDFMANVIFGFEGQIRWPTGMEYYLSDTAIDDAFNDGSFRWIDDFIGFADIPPRQRPQGRILTRLRLIDLTFRIAYPERAKMIAK